MSIIDNKRLLEADQMVVLQSNKQGITIEVLKNRKNGRLGDITAADLIKYYIKGN